MTVTNSITGPETGEPASFQYVLPRGQMVHNIIAGDESVSDSEYRWTLDAPDGQNWLKVPSFDADANQRACKIGSKAESRVREYGNDALAQILYDASIILTNDQELPWIVVAETGKPISEARSEVLSAARVLRQYSRIIPEASRGRVENSVSMSVWGVAIPEPVGLSLLVLPWNLPVQILVHKLAAALSARCPVIVKPSPLSPLSAARVVRAFTHSGLSREAISVVHGGPQTVYDLLSRPEIKMISFTGGTKAGKAVRIAAAQNDVKVVTELGGKSANIVLEDADLEKLVASILRGLTRNQGATCTAPTRLLVSNQRSAEIRDLLTIKMDEISPSDPYDEASRLGATRTKDIAERANRRLADSRTRGADVCGGQEITVPNRKGIFIRPAIVWGPSVEDPILTEELFAPVLTVQEFDTVDSAVELTNESPFGLSAGVWATDTEKAKCIAERLHVGTVHINHYGRRDSIDLPASGRGDSGTGAEGGPEGVREFQELKSIHIAKGD